MHRAWSKETYYTVKRDLLHCQKRPTKMSKETYYTVKRDLLHWKRWHAQGLVGAFKGVVGEKHRPKIDPK